MADKYARWNRWAAQFIADLVHDFGLTPEQAAGFVGNFAAESAYFNDIVEDAAIAKGWAGGTGFAQWTGPRRKSFEAWLKRKGWAADSYEGNYSYLFRELTTTEKAALEHVKGATTPENAAWRVARYFERPAVINTGPRAKAALEALALYRAHPVPPTVWPTDLDRHEEVPVPVTPTPVGPITPIGGTNEERAIPWYDSTQLKISLTGIVSTFTALAGAYDSALPWSRQNWVVLGPLLVGFLSAVIAFAHRIFADAQPVTGTQKGADKINAERTAQATAQAAEVSVISPVPIAQVPIAHQPVAQQMAQPLEAMPLNQLVNELPQVFNLIGAIFPQAALFLKVAEGLSHLADPNAPKWPPSTQPRP